jgi:hypothetical protein
MKLRIKGNSLRLRLTQSEVARIGRGEQVSETVDFGAGARLTYSLESDANAAQITARFVDNCITIVLPATQAREWTNTELVGLRAEHTLATESTTATMAGDESAQKLTLLIEKDFICIDGDSSEDQADAYPNPNLKC